MDDGQNWPGRRLTTSGGSVFVRHDPDAVREPSLPPALFVHGLGGESLDWDGVAGGLREELDCYALDLPGFADSPPPVDGDLSLDGHARAVADVARHIATRRALAGPLPGADQPRGVHLVGNSFGGAIAVRVAAEHPDLVASLILISPALPDLRVRLSDVELTLALLPVVGPALVSAVIHADPHRMAARIYRMCYGEPSDVRPARHARELDSLRRRAALPHAALAYRSALSAVAASYLDRGPRRLWKQAAAVGVPTLLVYGERDKLVNPRMAVRAQHVFGDAEVVRLPRVGHVAHLEQPAMVATAIGAFLRAHDLGGGMEQRRGTVVPSVR